LLELNRIICRRIGQLQDQENMQALSQLRVGSKVTFMVGRVQRLGSLPRSTVRA
jgi:hypothetical protein